MKKSVLVLGIDQNMDDVELNVGKDEAIKDSRNGLNKIKQKLIPFIGEDPSGLFGELEEAINDVAFRQIRAAYEIGLADGISHMDELKNLIKQRGTK